MNRIAPFVKPAGFFLFPCTHNEWIVILLLIQINDNSSVPALCDFTVKLLWDVPDYYLIKVYIYIYLILARLVIAIIMQIFSPFVPYFMQETQFTRSELA